MKTYLPAVLLAASLALPGGVRAEDLKGADAILKPFNAAEEKAPPVPDTRDSEAKIRGDLMAFRKISLTLAPAAAAKAWVGLAVRFINYNLSFGEMAVERNEKEPFSFTLVVASLPPPAAWDEIAREVETLPVPANFLSTRMLALKALAHRLDGNGDAVKKDIAALDDDLKEDTDHPLDGLHSILLGESDPAGAELKEFNGFLPEYTETKGARPESFQVPDLVRIVGKEKAAAFFHDAMLCYATIEIDEGDETRKLAQQVALDMLPSMKVPQWSLARDIDGGKLYEALLKRFPPPAGAPDKDSTDPFGGYDNVNGKWRPVLNINYLLGLIDARRIDDANAYALQFEGDAPSFYYGSGIGYAGDLDDGAKMPEYVDFFHDLLAKNPNLPFWDFYVSAAPLAGKRKEMVTMLEAAAKREGFTDFQRQEFQAILRNAYFADDRIDEAVAIIRKEGSESELDWLGRLLDRKDLIAKPLSTKDLHPKDGGEAASMAEALAKDGHPREAEALVAHALPLAKTPAEKRALQWALFIIYHYADRPADVLKVLNESRYLGISDAGQIIAARYHGDEDYYGYYMAEAFAATGHKEMALKILNALICAGKDYDPAYELLVKIAPRDQALAMLDSFAAQDRYDPRTYTWKAKVLFDAGKYEQAEAAARQAIAIDPLDGNLEIGQQMLPYAVLADIREKRGDKKEAETLRGIATGINLCDEADQLSEGGLLTRAIKRYEEALTHFGNSFRIHFHLALCMEEYGDRAGAEEHFRRAYESAPAGFQYLQSTPSPQWQPPLFSTLLARDTGDKALPDLVKQHPDQAQMHYLLATLRFDEHRYAEALPELREATRLDPGYLEAWIILRRVCSLLYLPAADCDAANNQVLKLDPLQRHCGVPIEALADVKTAWAAIETAWKLRPHLQESIYPLPLSAAEVKKENTESAKQTYYPPTMPMMSGKLPYDPYAPGYVIAGNYFISELIEVLDNDRYNLMPGAFMGPYGPGGIP